MSRTATSRSFAVSLAVVAAGLAVVTLPQAPPANADPGSVTGTVFRDFDLDGAQDGASRTAAVDNGVGGVTVRAYGPDNEVLATVDTEPDGTYELEYPDTGVAGSTDVRVEFDLPAGYVASRSGADNGTAVQFTSNGGVADFGVAKPTDFSPANPRIAYARLVGPINATGGAIDLATATTIQSSLYGDRRATGTEAGRQEATAAQTGSLWGIATYGQDLIFSSAGLKRHAPLGPGGPGAVYWTAAGGAADATLLTTVANAGTNPRPTPIPSGYNWAVDAAAYPAVGRVGLGGLAVAPDRSALYSVNLNTKSLVRIPVTVGANGVPAAGAQTSTSIPAPAGCAAADNHPWGVSVVEGQTYVGTTCGAADNLTGQVYRYDPATGFDGIFSFSLGYPRGDAVNYPGIPQGGRSAAWQAWSDSTAPFSAQLWAVAPQALVSDIAVDRDGDLTIALKDRFGDMSGTRTKAPSDTAGTGPNYLTAVAGDVLRACVNGQGGYTLETNAVCGDQTGALPGDGAGPGGGEFYNDDFFDGANKVHDQIGLGAVLQVPGFSQAVGTTIDPHQNAIQTNGYRFWRNSDGNGDFVTNNGATAADWRQVGGSADSSSTESFGKAGGMSDLDRFAPPTAPVEIGNRVWLDSDRNGRQDAGEPGIAAVQVQLLSGGTVVGTTVTDADGEYYFTDTNVTGGLTPGATYTVRLARAADYAAGGPLAGLRLTTADDVGDDDLDSDATLVGGVRQMSVTAPASGANHSYDVGFVGFRYAVGDTVFSDTDGDGVQDGDEEGLAGVTVTLLGANGEPVPGIPAQTTGPDGQYLFDALPAGTYSVRFSGIPEDAVFSPADAGGDDAVDSDAVPGPGGRVATTATFVLGQGAANVTAVPAGSTLAADFQNLTVDAGVFPQPTLQATLDVTRRAFPADQLRISLRDADGDEVAGDGTGDGDTADTGAQVVAPGVYTVVAGLVGGPGTPADYAFTISCADQDGPVGATLVAGTTNQWTLDAIAAPQDVVCEVTAAGLVPGIELDLTASDPADTNGNGREDRGDTITYTYTVTNNGDVALTDLTFDEVTFSGTGPFAAPVCTAEADELAVGETVTCTATYVLTQADVDRGEVTNTATVTGEAPGGLPNPTSAEDTEETVIDGTVGPGITLDRTVTLVDQPGGTDGVGDRGETIEYSYTVTNTGNRSLTGVEIQDDLLAAAGITITCPTRTLVSGDSFVCTADRPYTITDADLYAGSVDSTATASGLRAGGGTDTSAPAPAATPTVAADPDLTLTKVADWDDADSDDTLDAGETIDYTFLLENTGNVALADLQVDDPIIGAVDCPAVTLQPGGSATCTAPTYVVQNTGDVVTNTATASAQPVAGPAGQRVESNDSSTTSPSPPTPTIRLDVTPTVDPAANQDAAEVDNTISYVFTVTNVGNITVTNPVVTLGAGFAPGATVTCPAGSLRPGQSVECSSTDTTYTVTQDDIDTGGAITRTATADATTTVVGAPVPQVEDEAVVPLRGAVPGILTTVTTDPPAGTAVREGDDLTYTVTVRNTGNVTLTLADEPVWTGPGTLDCPALPTDLAPGQTFVCTTTVTITSAQVADGRILATATTTGSAPDGTEVTDDDAVRTTVLSDPAISVELSTDPATSPVVGQPPGYPVNDLDDNGVDAGDTIVYRVTITNTGDTTLDPVTASGIPGLVCDEGPLAPGASVVCTVTYELTQTDVDRGSVTAAVTATGTPPRGAAVTDASGDLTTALAPRPALTVVPTAGPVVDGDRNGTDAGDTITYTVVVTNRGNVTLTDVTVGGLPGLDCGTTTELAPGDSVTCTVTYTLTQGDIDAGRAAQTFTATGQPPGQGAPVEGERPITTPLDGIGAASLDVDVNPSDAGPVEEGRTITWDVVVTNDGPVSVTLEPGSVTGNFGGPLTCDPALPVTLAPGESTTCTSAPYTVRPADVAIGSIDRTATATGTPANGGTVQGQGASSIVVRDEPAIDVTLTYGNVVDGDDNGVDRGDTITYTVRVENTGDTTLDPVTLRGIAGLECDTTGSLAPGEVRTCTATYTLTQGDVDNGFLAPAVTATGTSPGAGGQVTDRASDRIVIVGDPELEVELTGTLDTDNPDGLAEAGDTITYTVTVRNAGTVTLTDIRVPGFGYGAVTCEESILGPGESTQCTVEDVRVVSQADVDAGQPLTAEVEAFATPPGGLVGELRATDDTSQGVAQAAPGLDVTIRPTPAGEVTEGTTIRYDVVLTNTGNTTLTVGTVTSPDLGAITCPGTEPRTIAPGRTLVCTAPAYVVDADDVAAGSVDRSVSATVTAPGGTPVSDTDEVSSPVDDSPEIEVTLEAGPIVDADRSGTVNAGDTVVYTVTVTNTGTTTLTDVSVTGIPGLQCTAPSLGAGRSQVCQVTYTLDQDDIDNGSLDPSVVAVGTDPGQGQVEDTASLDQPIDFTGVPGLTIDLVGELDTDNANGNAEAGDTITYTVRVTNSGDTTLTGVTVRDFGYGTVTCDPTTLAPGQSTVCTVERQRTVSQADVDSGQPLRAEATAVATAPGGAPGAVTDTDATTQAVVAANPRLELEAAATPDDSNGNGRIDAGETITYTYTVTNVGNVRIDDVVVTDPAVGPVTCVPTSLEPGQSATCTAAPYTVTQDDVDTGFVVINPTADGDPVRGTLEPADDTLRTPLTVIVSQELVKTAQLRDRNGNGAADAGETIAYTFAVRNSGTQTLTNVTVTDRALGTVTCPAGDLAPGDTVTCEADAVRTVTQADVDAERPLVNTATSSAETPGGAEAGGQDSATVPVTQAVRGLAITKTAVHSDADGDGRLDVGETIQYSFLVENTGNVTIEDIEVDDPKVDGITCEATTLAGGEATTCEADAPYVITQRDVDAGQVRNTATASGQPIDGSDPITSDPDTVVTDGPSTGAIQLRKRGVWRDLNNNEKIDPGERIRYTFRVTNTGDVDVTGLRIRDRMLERAGIAITCDTRRLAPGESTECAAERRYTVTDRDVQKPRLRNIAAAVGFAGLDRVVSVAGVTAPTGDDPIPGPGTNPPGGNPGGGSSGGVSSGSDGLLPNTGAPAAGLAGLAALMLLAGTILVRRSRRRQA